MGYTTAYDETERLDLGDGWWVEVRKCLPGGVRRKIAAGMVHYGVAESKDAAGNPSFGVTLTDVDPSWAQTEYALASIVDWNLTDGDDEVLPLTPDAAKRASYALLREEHLDLIEEYASVANREVSRDEAGRFPVNGTGSLAERPYTAPDPGEVLARAAVVGDTGTQD